MSLPDAWVDRIFEKLTLVYGHRFLRQWEGLDMAAVKRDWSYELRGFQQSPQAIGYGLEHLPPDEAPTVLQFRDLCRRVPESQGSLPMPKPTAEEREKAARICRDLRIRIGADVADPRDWAYDLQAREKRGEELSPVQAKAWREALAIVPSEHPGMTFKPVVEAALPPAMRSQQP